MNIIRNNKILGLGLISGGLDSLIATHILKLQNIEVIGLNFKSPFCICDKAYKNSECGLQTFYSKFGMEILFCQKEDDYLKIVNNPKFGYGRHLNPCIDCRIYILKKAKKIAKKIEADFIFTGEVLNQRPKSQNRKALNIIEEETGMKGKLLRPLSALLLEPTILEKKGMINRSKLLGIHGRSRKTQLDIARNYGLLNEYYACGGCLLTDSGFTRRMEDYLEYNKNYKMKDINLLKLGRHFRFKDSKIIVGRNQSENKKLIKLKNPKDIIMEVENVPGPITVIHGNLNSEILSFAAKLTLRYSDVQTPYGQVRYGRNYHSLVKGINNYKASMDEIENHII
ncbi:MAG: hypothetical protein ACFFB1_10990 [Promethearchaeota archaeon]